MKHPTTLIGLKGFTLRQCQELKVGKAESSAVFEDFMKAYENLRNTTGGDVHRAVRKARFWMNAVLEDRRTYDLHRATHEELEEEFMLGRGSFVTDAGLVTVDIRLDAGPGRRSFAEVSAPGFNVQCATPATCKPEGPSAFYARLASFLKDLAGNLKKS